MLVKVTDENMQTYGGFQWRLKERKVIPDASINAPLCSDKWFHCFDDTDLAFVVWPAYVEFSKPRFFVAESSGLEKYEGLKVGVSELTLIKEIPYEPIPLDRLLKIGEKFVNTVPSIGGTWYYSDMMRNLAYAIEGGTSVYKRSRWLSYTLCYTNVLGCKKETIIKIIRETT